MKETYWKGVVSVIKLRISETIMTIPFRVRPL